MDEDELNIEERDLSIKAGEKQSMVFASKVKAINSEKGTVDVIMSDASIDRYREVIDPRAWKKGLANYKKHPVLLSSHNYHGLTNQIGKAETIKVNKDGQLEARMKYFVGKGNPEADWGFFLAEEGVAAYSVGFIPKSYVYNSEGDFEVLAKELGYSKKEAAQIRVIFTEVELLENSHVLVPANPAGLLKGMESEEVQNDALLKSLYSEALDKIDSFKDFFETKGAEAISKSFGELLDYEAPVSRIKRVKKENKLKEGAEEVMAAIKGLDGTEKELSNEDKELIGAILSAVKNLGGNPDTPSDDATVGEDTPTQVKKEADLKELSTSLKELEGKNDNSEEVVAFWALAKEKGFSVDEVLTEVEEFADSGDPAAPKVKDASDALLDREEMVADENPINDDGSIEIKNAKDAAIGEKPLTQEEKIAAIKEILGSDSLEDGEEATEDDSVVEKDLDDSAEEGVVEKGLEEEMSPEVEAIKDATDSAVEKINTVVKTAIEQFSSLTLESTKTAEKIEAFGNDLEAVKSMLTDLEENKIEVKEAEEVTKNSMRELLAGIKTATNKIGAKEVPSEKG